MEEFNVERDWAPPLIIRYECIWCGGYHMKRAKDKHERARGDRLRRKWMVEQNRIESDPAATKVYQHWLRTGELIYD